MTQILRLFFNKHDFYQTDFVLERLRSFSINFLVLAGFLWMIPENILNQFSGKIINIHPALLPCYGGKGMYGDAVHKAVIGNHDKESGISIHYVNKLYDKGDIIFQERCKVDPSDTPDLLAEKVHALEYLHYPKIIEDLVIKLPDFLIKGPEEA